MQKRLTACQTKMRDSNPCGCADYAKHLFYAKYIYCLTIFIIVLWVAIITVQITAIYHRYAHVVNLSAKSIAHIKSPSRNRS